MVKTSIRFLCQFYAYVFASLSYDAFLLLRPNTRSIWPWLGTLTRAVAVTEGRGLNIYFVLHFVTLIFLTKLFISAMAC